MTPPFCCDVCGRPRWDLRPLGDWDWWCEECEADMGLGYRDEPAQPELLEVPR